MNPSQKKKAKIIAGEVIVNEIQRLLDKGHTPVKDGDYKRMMADGKTVSKLFESGDMRAHITHEDHDKGVKVGIFKDAPELEKLKASGHNRGDSANGVKREFIPTRDSSFRDSIMNKVTKAINSEVPKRERKKAKTITPEEEGIITIDDLFGDKFLDSIIREASRSVSSPTALGTAFMLFDFEDE